MNIDQLIELSKTMTVTQLIDHLRSTTELNDETIFYLISLISQ